MRSVSSGPRHADATRAGPTAMPALPARSRADCIVPGPFRRASRSVMQPDGSAVRIGCQQAAGATGDQQRKDSTGRAKPRRVTWNRCRTIRCAAIARRLLARFIAESPRRTALGSRSRLDGRSRRVRARSRTSMLAARASMRVAAFRRGWSRGSTQPPVICIHELLEAFGGAREFLRGDAGIVHYVVQRRLRPVHRALQLRGASCQCRRRQLPQVTGQQARVLLRQLRQRARMHVRDSRASPSHGARSRRRAVLRGASSPSTPCSTCREISPARPRSCPCAQRSRDTCRLGGNCRVRRLRSDPAAGRCTADP